MFTSHHIIALMLLIAASRNIEVAKPMPTEPKKVSLEQTKPRVDLCGDQLPAGAMARLGTLRWRHEEHAIAFSPDGSRIVTGDGAGTFRVFDTSWTFAGFFDHNILQINDLRDSIESLRAV